MYTYRVEVFSAEPFDVTGFDVEASDGHIGMVDEATVVDANSCLVVDTGFWIFGKLPLLPPIAREKLPARSAPSRGL